VSLEVTRPSHSSSRGRGHRGPTRRPSPRRSGGPRPASPSCALGSLQPAPRPPCGCWPGPPPFSPGPTTPRRALCRPVVRGGIRLLFSPRIGRLCAERKSIDQTTKGRLMVEKKRRIIIHNTLSSMPNRKIEYITPVVLYHMEIAASTPTAGIDWPSWRVRPGSPRPSDLGLTRPRPPTLRGAPEGYPAIRLGACTEALPPLSWALCLSNRPPAHLAAAGAGLPPFHPP
jgi:hypothetical protein